MSGKKYPHDRDSDREGIPSKDKVVQLAHKLSNQVLSQPIDSSSSRRTSFAVAQICETMNSTEQRRSRFSQKTQGVIITTSAEEILEKGKVAAVNDYFFLKTLGKGAFGEVRLATKDLVEDNLSEDHERYAIKVLKRMQLAVGNKGLPDRPGRMNQSSVPDWMESLPEVLQQEINVMKLLVHNNLVKLVEIINDLESPNLYLVLEYVEGGPVMQHDPVTNKFVYTLTGQVMGEATARRSFTDLLSGLAFMHANHVAHRDIKPDNLLIDFKGKLKLSDFGVSSHFHSDRKKVSIQLSELKKSTSRGVSYKTEGTFPFYSPEMCSERASAFSAYMADTWAACVCLWIFIFGVLPFQHRDVTELFRQIREVDPQRPHRVSVELDDLLTVAFSKDSSVRPYVYELRHHCWITRCSLKYYQAQNITYHRDTGSVDYGDVTSPAPEDISPLRISYQPYEKMPVSERVICSLLTKAARAKKICRERHDAFVLKLKNEINLLVRKKLSQAGMEKRFQSRMDGSTSSAFEDRDEDSSSDGSDPLGMMLTNITEDPGQGQCSGDDKSPDRDRSSWRPKTRQSLSEKIGKFKTSMNVLQSVEDMSSSTPTADTNMASSSICTVM